MKADDIPFIYSTWLKGLQYGNTLFRQIDSGTYMKKYRLVLDMIIQDEKNTVLVACLKDSPEIILGYSVSGSGKLHWIFMKKAWRGFGIAKELIPKDFRAVTHLTTVGKDILKNKYPNVIFDPFL